MNRTLLAAALLSFSVTSSAALVCQNETYGQHAVWRVGDSAAALDAVDRDGVVSCEAHDAELTYIAQNFTGLRLRNGHNLDRKRIVFWTGDDAVFILNNL
jgi:hypothetical protein